MKPIESSRAAGIWVGTLLISAAAAGAIWLQLGLPIPACRFREWTGLPCATCGTTRMAKALLAGDVAGAIAFNPMVFTGLAALCVWSLESVILALAGRPTRRIALGPRVHLALGLAFALAFAGGWAYQIWRGI